MKTKEGRVIAYAADSVDTSNPGLNWWMKSIEQLPDKAMSRKKTSKPATLGFPEKCDPLLTWCTPN